MKYLTILFIGLVMFASCGSEEAKQADTTVETEETKDEPTKEELDESSQKLIAKLLDAKELNLQLNNGEKWLLNEDAFTKLMKIKQQIYVISGNMESYEMQSYNTMGAEFLDFVKTIPVQENEAANAEMQKVISRTKEQCLHMVESNLQFAQIAVINLSIIYDEVPNYFEAEK
jgi:hypothetical protein